jgi:hypothetical protein
VWEGGVETRQGVRSTVLDQTMILSTHIQSSWSCVSNMG